MKKTLILVAIVATALSSCSKENNGENTITGDAIEFRTVVDKSKATPAIMASISNFSINAVYKTTPTTFDFMKNAPVVKDGASWDYSPKKYYPSDASASNQVSFYASSPASSVNVNSISTAAGKAIIDYTVPVAYDGVVKTQEDFLVSYHRSFAGQVAFTFKHALSSATFSALNKSENATFIVEGISLVSLGSQASLTIDPAATAPADYVWAAPATFTSSYVATLPPAGISVLYNPALTPTTQVAKGLTSADNILMVLPQDLTSRGGTTSTTVPADLAAKSYLVVTYKSVDGANQPINPTGTKKYFKLSTNFQMGKQYNFVISFDAGGPIDFTVTTIDGWGTATDVPAV